VLPGVTSLAIKENNDAGYITLPPFLPPEPTALKVLELLKVNLDPTELEDAIVSSKLHGLSSLLVCGIGRHDQDWPEGSGP
jgi:hypothetical protein